MTGLETILISATSLFIGVVGTILVQNRFIVMKDDCKQKRDQCENLREIVNSQTVATLKELKAHVCELKDRVRHVERLIRTVLNNQKINITEDMK